MEYLMEKFRQEFNMEMVARDLMGMIAEDTLYNYMVEEFNSDFTYGELYDVFSQDLDKEDLQCLLEELGHDFVDLDELDEEEREKYY